MAEIAYWYKQWVEGSKEALAVHYMHRKHPNGEPFWKRDIESFGEVPDVIEKIILKGEGKYDKLTISGIIINEYEIVEGLLAEMASSKDRFTRDWFEAIDLSPAIRPGKFWSEEVFKHLKIHFADQIHETEWWKANSRKIANAVRKSNVVKKVMDT